MRLENSDYPNFLDKDDPAFSTFLITLDNLFKALRADGIGTNSLHTEGISNEEENRLWTSCVMNTNTPKGLLRAVFYYNGKCFCLRGGQEHSDFGISQLHRLYNPDRYIYKENASKNRQGGIAQMRLEHKSVTIVANPVVGERCHVFLLDTYISKLPPAAIEKDIFYCKPLSNIPTDPTNPWYLPVPVGRNLLGKMVQDMCSDAGIEGKKTNHSLRVSGASTLFEAGVPERVIQQRTGHRSLLSLRMYERVSEGQEKAVSRILTGENNNYNESLMQSITSSSTLPSKVSCNESLIQSITSSSSLPSKVSCNESSSMLQSSIPSSKSSGIHCNLVILLHFLIIISLISHHLFHRCLIPPMQKSNESNFLIHYL